MPIGECCALRVQDLATSHVPMMMYGLVPFPVASLVNWRLPILRFSRAVAVKVCAPCSSAWCIAWSQPTNHKPRQASSTVLSLCPKNAAQ